MNKVELWINGNYILRCILPLFPPTKLTIYNLKRMVCYVKSKNSPIADGNILKLSIEMWKHIACQKLGLSANVCETYFDVYWQYEHGKDTKDDELPMKKVSLVSFTMFLFMQLVNRKNICDLVDDSERYPVASMQLSADRLSKSREHSAELTVLKFIQRNLRDIMEIISLHGNEVRDYKNPELSCYSCSGAGLKCLNDIFEGREVDTIKNVVSFSSLCKLRFDFTKDLNLKSVEKWIRCSLGSDPYAVASSSYQNASVSNNSHLKSGYLGDLRAILHNSHSAPLNRKTVILNGITRKTVIKVKHNHVRLSPMSKDGPSPMFLLIEELNYLVDDSISEIFSLFQLIDNDIVFDSHTHVTNCKNAFVYLTVFLKCLIVKKCRQVSVVTRLIGETLRIQNCSDVRITAIAGRIIISNCQRCTFNISTNSRPLIFGTGNENLVFGPYNMTKFSDEKSPKVDNFTDFGDQPLCFQNDNTPRIDRCIWSLMEPRDFRLICVPFHNSDDRKPVAPKLPKVEIRLPAPYQRELFSRCEKVKTWTKIMKTLSTNQCATLQNFMQEKFIAWLKDNKRVEELLQLKKLESRKSNKM